MIEPRSDWPTLASAPRPLPWSTSLGLRFGLKLSRASVFILLFALIPIWIVLSNADIAQLWRFRGPREQATAVITNVEHTGVTEGGSRHRKGRPIERVDFHFEYAGAAHDGISYGAVQAPKPGATCEVEFPAGHPEWARVCGMRADLYGPQSLLILVLVAIAAGLFVRGLFVARRVVRLVEWGRSATGKVLELTATHVRVNRARRFRVKYEFALHDGRMQSVDSTTLHPERYEDPRGLRILFDPHEPRDARVVDDLPIPVSFDARGRVLAQPLGRMLSLLAPPVLVIVGYSAWGIWLALR